MESSKSQSLLFSLDGTPHLSEAFPLALQHVVAMIVGCVTPAIIVAGVAKLNHGRFHQCHQRRHFSIA